MRRVGSLATALLLCAGCLAIPGLSNDTFQDWSAVPLPPDQRLVEAAGPACAPNGGAQQRTILHDRRTARTALFVYHAGESFGYCVESAGSGFGIGGEGMLPARAGDRLSVDHAMAADGPDLTLALGRAPSTAVRVEVRTDAGRVAEASLAEGIWAAWFPGLSTSVTVVAFDRTGAEIARLARPTR